MKRLTFTLTTVLALGGSGCETPPAPALKSSDPRFLMVCTAGQLEMLSSYVSPQSQNFHVLNDERKAKVQWTEDLFPGDRYRVVGKTQEDGKIFFTMKANTSHHVFFVDVKTGEVSTKVRSQRRGFSYTATKAVLMPQCSVAAPTM